MLTDYLRRWGRGILNPIAEFVNRIGVPPNVVTITGFLLTAAVALVLALGYIQLAGALLIVAAFFDAIDGALARLIHQATRFGAFLDSTMDRFSEAALFLGVLLHFYGQSASAEVILTYVAIVGSLMVSYTRARAEGVGVSITGGVFTRVERTLVLIIGLLANQLSITLWILAVMTNFTALQRVWLAWRATQDESVAPK